METKIPPPPVSGGELFDGMVGDRLVVMGFDARKRVVGSIFDPATGAWTTVATRGAPQLRAQSYGRPTVVGRHLLVGMFTPEPKDLVFDPVRNRWIDPGKWPIPWPWNGVGLDDAWLIWQSDSFEKGLRLDLGTARWSPISAAGAPSGRSAASIVRCGDQVLVWGGWIVRTEGDPPVRSLVPLGDGAVYDTRADRWRPVSSANAPAARGRAFAGCLDDGHAVIYGGSGSTKWENSEHPVLADGAVYEFGADRWTPLSQPGGPTGPLLERDPPFFASGGRLAYYFHLNESFYEAFVLDPEAPRWERLPKPPGPGFWARPVAEDGVLHLAAYSLGLLDLAPARWCRPEGGEAAPQDPGELSPGAVARVPVDELPPRWRAFGAGPGYALLWGPVTIVDDCPDCPPGAPCLPCNPKVLTGRDGRLFRW